MGFLGSNTKTVDLGNDYWAKVRELTVEEYKPVEAVLAKAKIQNEQLDLAMDLTEYRRMLVSAALEGWNLTDENDEPLELTRASVDRLPIGAFEQIRQAVDSLNGSKRGREAARFPDGSDGGGQDGAGGSAGVAAVPAGAGAVEAAG